MEVGQRILELGKHGLHDKILSMMIATQAVSIAYRLIRFDKNSDPYLPTREGDYSTLSGNRCGVDLRFPTYGPIESALAGVIPQYIGLNFVEQKPDPPNYSVWAAGIQASAPTDGLGELIQHLFSPFFVEFYEDYRQWVYDTCGRPDNWPEVWRFGRVVRNAISHGGKIKIERPEERSVYWYKLTYSAADNGTTVLGYIIGLGDMVTLMIEMSDELDRLGCPILNARGPRHRREYFGWAADQNTGLAALNPSYVVGLISSIAGMS